MPGAAPARKTSCSCKTDFPALNIIKLEQNYRSTGRILKAANTLIDNNPHLISKVLWSELGPGDPLRFISSENEETECERVVNEIIDMRLKRRCKYSDFAVLYRGNYQAKLVEIKLQTQNIPYEITGGQSFYAKTEIKDVMAYLRLIINPSDDNALLRIINTPRRQIGPTTLEKLGEYCQPAQSVPVRRHRRSRPHRHHARQQLRAPKTL